MPAEEANYIFLSNRTYKNNGRLENEEEILANIRKQIIDDPQNMNAGCALIRLPLFVFTGLLCMFGVVGGAPTIYSMIMENRINIFILLGWFSVILGACASLYWSWLCLKAIVNGPPDYDQLARSHYQRLITHGKLVDTRVIRLASPAENHHIIFSVSGKPFVHITRYGAIKESDYVKALCVDGICVLL
jgi:hypothetical protein